MILIAFSLTALDSSAVPDADLGRACAMRTLEEEMTIEYIGKLLSDEHLSVTPEVLSRFRRGQLFKITIEPLPTHACREMHDKKLMDGATQRFLARLENAPRLGRIKGDLSREDMYEDMADERL